MGIRITPFAPSITEEQLTQLAGLIQNSYRKRLVYSDHIHHSFGYQFKVSDNYLVNGSVCLMINGVTYCSDLDQTNQEPNKDFHINNNYIIIHNKSNGGTFDLKDTDSIIISYREE